mgnify:FL=1
MILYILVLFLGCDDMDSSYLPAGYKPLLDIRQTQVAIKKVKDFFERDLAIQHNLGASSPT